MVQYASKNSFPSMIFENKLVHLNKLTGSTCMFLCHERHAINLVALWFCFFWLGKSGKERIRSGYNQLSSEIFMFYLGLDTSVFKDNRNPLRCSFMFFQFWQLLLSSERMPGQQKQFELLNIPGTP